MNPIMNVVGVSGSRNKSIVQQFKEFRASFKCDPREKINEMLSSGQITQEQLNQAKTANLISQLRPFTTQAYITCSQYQATNVGCGFTGLGCNSCGCNA